MMASGTGTHHATSSGNQIQDLLPTTLDMTGKTIISEEQRRLRLMEILDAAIEISDIISHYDDTDIFLEKQPAP